MSKGSLKKSAAESGVSPLHYVLHCVGALIAFLVVLAGVSSVSSWFGGFDFIVGFILFVLIGTWLHYEIELDCRPYKAERDNLVSAHEDKLKEMETEYDRRLQIERNESFRLRNEIIDLQRKLAEYEKRPE